MSPSTDQFEIVDDPTKFSGERIRAFRLSQGVTLEELAERSEISVSHLSRMEAGRRGLSFNMMTRIAAALDVPPRQLLPIKQYVPMLGYVNETKAVEFRTTRDISGVLAHDLATKDTVALRFSTKGLHKVFSGWVLYYERKSVSFNKYYPYATSIVEFEDGASFLTGCSIVRRDADYVANFNIDDETYSSRVPVAVYPVTCMLPEEASEPGREITFRRS